MSNKMNVLLVSIPLIIIGCKKFLHVDPPGTYLVGQTAYNSDATAMAAVTGIYQSMVGGTVGGGTSGITTLLGLSADEYGLYPNAATTWNQTFTNSLRSTSGIPIWNELYSYIYRSNSAFEEILKSSKVTNSIKQQLIGETKFIRALCHFYLSNIYGDIPIVTTSNYSVNKELKRSPVREVYDSIIQDLKDAQLLLSNNYLNPNGTIASQRVRPNKATATALLARTYLYLKKWNEAIAEASAIISDAKFELSTDLNSVFVAYNNKEAIFQLESPNSGYDAPDGSFFLSGYKFYGGPTAIYPFSLNDSLIKNFELDDLRRTNWILSSTVGGQIYYFPNKYKEVGYTGKPPKYYPTIFRLAEQYLIRAEAKVHVGDLNGAKVDLNSIRIRAGLTNTPVTTDAEMLDAILKERRLEFFAELGHRWLDIKRTLKVNDIMNVVTPLKAGTWQNTDQFYPIPSVEIERNYNLIQNDGY